MTCEASPSTIHPNSRARAGNLKLENMTITTREVSHVTIVDIRGRITLGDETGKLRDTCLLYTSGGQGNIGVKKLNVSLSGYANLGNQECP